MLNFSPNPKNRLYTNFNSYLMFLQYLLWGRWQSDREGIREFERALSDRVGTSEAVCVYQCRLGIYLAVKALIQPDRPEVILSAYTMTDIINMVIFAGGIPVFADVDLETCNISVAEVERLITPKTGAVLITHLHGLAAAAHQIKEICDRTQIPLIEDAAQSFGVTDRQQAVGTIGDVGVFSFEMHKNMPTFLGGAVVSNRSDVIEKIRAELSSFTYPALPGIVQKVKKGSIHDLAGLPVVFQLLTYPIVRFSYLNDIEFINQRVRRKPQESKPAAELPDLYKSQYTPFQARLGLSQMHRVDRDIQTRIEYSQIYYAGLKDLDGLILTPLRTDGSNTYLWFPILCADRAELLRFMFERGRDLAAGHFPNTADLPQFQDFYRDCPHARQVERELVYLPTYPSYSRAEVEKNIEVIHQYFAAKATSNPASHEKMPATLNISSRV
jgi:perosamine synthetase